MAAVALSVSILSIVLAAGTAYLQLLRGPKSSLFGLGGEGAGRS
jgi:hypothetical protein